MKTGIELIAAERQEQVDKHGFVSEHDKQHVHGQLLMAAIHAIYGGGIMPSGFEWFESKISTKTKLERLAIAGALIAAEIDRCLAMSKIPENG